MRSKRTTGDGKANEFMSLGVSLGDGGFYSFIRSLESLGDGGFYSFIHLALIAPPDPNLAGRAYNNGSACRLPWRPGKLGGGPV